MDSPVQDADFDAVTAAQQQTWASGDFHQIARQNVCIAEALCQTIDPHPGERVLDIACGSGTAALVTARRYCEVTGIDYVPALIQRARQRAAADDLAAKFQVGDAQSLPFADASFDVVLSVYGVQFAPDQTRAARELLRVCRPGGRIALATPFTEGWSADFFATNARHMPPPPGVESPLCWATDEGLAALLGDGVHSLQNETRTALQYYRSMDHACEVFLRYFGPAIRAAGASNEQALREDLKAVFQRYNQATDGTAIIKNTWLLTRAIRV